MKNRYFRIVLTVVLLLVLTLITGSYLTPRNANAIQWYTIQVIDPDGDDAGPVDGVLVQFWFDGEMEFQGTTDETGKVHYARPEQFPDDWDAFYTCTFTQPGSDWQAVEFPSQVYVFEVEDLRQ